MNRKALLVAFHFPPIKASSGLERTLALARHLPALGWEPAVLTAHPMAYERTSTERMEGLDGSVPVHRAFALDTARHLAVAGRYPGWLAQPDRWRTWMLGAIPTGLAMIRRYRPQVIWSTYPIVTAHDIGYWLHRLSGVPWVADFRDPMVEFDDRQQVWHPGHPRLRKMRLDTEGRAAAHARALTFCTRSALSICAARYPQADQSLWRVVPNGFDESAFQTAAPVAPSRPADAPLWLLHSGTIYPTPDRDPTHFLRALAQVRAARGTHRRPVRVVLRGSGVERLYADLIRELDLQDWVSFEPVVDYISALREMQQVDGLLLFQGYTSNPAIPAKLYEYFRAGRPILAMVDDAGDTAALLKSNGVGSFAPLDDAEQIAASLHAFLDALERGEAQGMPREQAATFERGVATQGFARLFDDVAAASPRI